MLRSFRGHIFSPFTVNFHFEVWLASSHPRPRPRDAASWRSDALNANFSHLSPFQSERRDSRQTNAYFSTNNSPSNYWWKRKTLWTERLVGGIIVDSESWIFGEGELISLIFRGSGGSKQRKSGYSLIVISTSLDFSGTLMKF